MKRLAIFLMTGLFAVGAQATVVEIKVVPTMWKLENYSGDNVVVWHAPTNCANGNLTFSSMATKEDKNRFWSVIMAAKIAQKEVFVRYDNETSGCTIMSFGMHE